MQRRAILITLGASALPLASRSQEARPAYPSRTVRIVVPGAPGTVNDIIARAISSHLAAALGQPVVVENKPGADGVIAAVEVARAVPDGHTISVINSSPLAANPHLKKKLPYSLDDFTPVGKLGSYTFALAGSTSLPGTLEGVLKFAQANPGAISYATGNITSILATRHIAAWAGVSMVQVPYKADTLALHDLIAGRVQLMLGTAGVIGPNVQAGKLRGLAVLGGQRSPLLPDVPTLSEAGVPPFEVTPCAGVFGPAKLPGDVVQRLNSTINAVLARSDVRQLCASQGFAIEPSTPEGLGALMRNQYVAWGNAVREAGIQPE